MTDRPIIELAGLTVRYGRLTAVEDLSLQVPRGSVYALLGRNGSGKSSTVRCLLGQQRATAGEAHIMGFDAWEHRRRIMRTVGVVPENPNIPPEMTADRLARFLARISTNWDREKFDSRLESFGVPRRTRFDRLSKGQQRQLSLTAAISTSPEILILDDPTLGLDPVARRELFEELVVELADRGTTVFVTTHDLAGIEGIADRVGIIKDGQLLIDEDLEGLKSRFRKLAWAPSSEHGKAGLPHELEDMTVVGEQVVAGGTREAVVADYRGRPPAADMSVTSLSLEEIFIALCGRNGGAR